MEVRGGDGPRDKLILVVDDDESVRQVIQCVAGREGFRCDSAEDGEEGLAKVRSLHPDLVMLDLMLPLRGGFEVLREMQMDETAGIPVVVMTGRYTDRSTADILRAEPNVKDFIEKPFRVKALGMLMHRLLRTVPLRAGGAGP